MLLTVRYQKGVMLAHSNAAVNPVFECHQMSDSLTSVDRIRR